jgi:hypothetical protein
MAGGALILRPVRMPSHPKKTLGGPPAPFDVYLREDGGLLQREDHGSILREESRSE